MMQRCKYKEDAMRRKVGKLSNVADVEPRMPFSGFIFPNGDFVRLGFGRHYELLRKAYGKDVDSEDVLQDTKIVSVQMYEMSVMFDGNYKPTRDQFRTIKDIVLCAKISRPEAVKSTNMTWAETCRIVPEEWN